MTDPATLFLQTARRNLSAGVNEHVVRSTLDQFLPQIFPDRPWWVRQHASGAEALTRFTKNDSLTHGFIDTLVGGTAVEYEPNLGASGVEEHARGQIRDYAAGEINRGLTADTLVGVISDTLRWQAFTVTASAPSAPRPHGRDDIALTRIDHIDLSVAGPNDAAELKRFLQTHLAREAARPLHGETLAADLGLESEIGARLRGELDRVYAGVAARRPDYATMVERLWGELVDAIGEGGSRHLGQTEYLDEFYLITLAKLICANVLDRKAPRRAEAELGDILSGAFFTRRGLRNYVEYDLFGWLSEDIARSGMLAVAETIQNDLIAYDFARAAQDDLFGRLLANLGRKSTRLILGQELTPPWLARRLVRDVAADLDEPLRLLDSACGSGAILVEAIRLEKTRPQDDETPAARAARLAASATGFDIDPLATIFAKTNWVVALRDELPLLPDATIPVFNTDALFSGGLTPTEDFAMSLDGEALRPPKGLMARGARRVFDDLLSSAYALAMAQARSPGMDPAAVPKLVDQILAGGETGLDRSELIAFTETLTAQLAKLEREGRNGLWAHVIRNTSRPVQSIGEFNALVINPPWLALSKIADNPYTGQLNHLAGLLGVRPEGSSSHHTELAIVFLLESLRRYLQEDAPLAVIVPASVMQGAHHTRFRRGDYASSTRPTPLDIEAVWELQKGVFKNEAIVLRGRRRSRVDRPSLVASIVSEAAIKASSLTVVKAADGARPDKVVWSRSGEGTSGFGYTPARFRQGADLMPRTVWFHDFQPHGDRRMSAAPIDSDRLRYLVADAKRSRTFRLPKGTILDRELTVEAALSNHLTPFNLDAPARMLLPGRFADGRWAALTSSDMALASEGARQALKAISGELGRPVSDLFQLVDLMGKLRNQTWSDDHWIVVSGAGGANPCAAAVPPGRFRPGAVVFDQTLYWAPVGGESEADYLVGAINSPQCAALIAPFQPKGERGKRHIHKLPFSITPPFDPDHERHVILASRSRALRLALADLAAQDAKVAAAQRPQSSTLAARRTLISQRLRALPNYSGYAEAAARVYEGP